MVNLRTRLFLSAAALALLGAACSADSSDPAPTTATSTADTSTTVAATVDDSNPADYDGPVTELAIRLVNGNVELVAFATARDTFVEALTIQPGVRTDREFKAFVDGTTFGPVTSPVFTGMTEYEDMAAFAAASTALGGSAEAGAFFATFEPAVFTALRPRNPGDRYPLADLASEPGQVLEIAVRDLSAYQDFDATDYEAKLKPFLETLSQQRGFVAEYQWVSVLDPNLVVGMTVYESAEAFSALALSEELSSIALPLLSDYPPQTSYIHTDAGDDSMPG